MRDLHRVKTPENVDFEFELAGVASRAAAWSLDLLVMTAMIGAIILVLTPFDLVTGGLASALLAIGIFLVQWWYSALCEWRWAGQTVGKRALGIRTLDATGLRLTFLQAVVRNLLRVVDVLPLFYFVGGTFALLDGKGRRLGDLAAGTVVVRERRAPKPTAFIPASEKHNTFAADPAVRIAARRITAKERDAMIALGLRREGLPIGLRRALFETLGKHLERRLGIARPTYLSDEKYVLNLTAATLGENERQEPSRPPLHARR